MESESTKREESLSDKLSYWILALSLFLVPIFFIPSSVISFQFSKLVLIYALVVVGVASWIIARLKDGKITFARNKIIVALLAIPLFYLLASIFSSTRAQAFIGQGFEIGSFSFIFGLVILCLLATHIFSTRKSIAYAYVAFLGSAVVVGLFHLIRLLFGPSVLAFNIFTTATSSLVGSWNDLGIYFGSIALLTFLTLELLTLSRMLRIVFIIILAFSLFFLSVINFTTVWYILAAIALVFFIYNFSFNKSRIGHEGGKERSLPIISLIVVIVSFIFIMSQGSIYAGLAGEPFNLSFFNRLSVNNVEVRPSWSSTFDVAKGTIKAHPVFGAGPNKFVSEWLRLKPAEINNTIFWATDFNYGIGLIPTFLITTGILGFLTWIVFLVMYVLLGVKALFSKIPDPFRRYTVISSFSISTYLWIFAFLYVPSASLLVALFVFTGIFLASLIEAGFIPVSTYNYVRNPRASFVFVLAFIAMLLSMLVFSYTLTRKFISSVYFNRGLEAANVKGDINGAENGLAQAIRFSENDLYYRTLSEIELVKMNQLLSQEGVSQDILQNQFRSLLANAQASAQAAVAYDPTNYENHIAVGRVSEVVLPLAGEEAFYENAKKSYLEAQRLNPQSPAMYLILARLEVAHKDVTKAKEYITEALKLKNNYTDAIFYLSQIQVSEGDLKSAIQSVEAAATLNPNDPGVYFQLGLLRYNDKNYSGAAAAFEQALLLSPGYANAQYFLGLSYEKLDRQADAIRLFEALKQSNSDNAEVDLILKNLKAGLDPFSGAKPPVDSAPEKRPEPPVKETTKADTADR